ncbi:MAG: CPBP family intramembrane glutamic endopeptidase [Clostridium sp.]
MYKLFYKTYGIVGNTVLKFPKLIMVLIAIIMPILAQIIGCYIGIPIIRSLGNTNPLFILFVMVTIQILLYFSFVRIVEKRKISTLGLKINKHTLYEYVIGFLIGFLMFSSAAILIILTGSAEISFKGLGYGGLWTYIFVIITWGFQGACEEIMMRGHTLPIIGKAINVPFAVLISSTFFSLLHILNNGLTTLALINLSLFGVFAALYALYSKNIWGICALHSSWNFAQGNLWGFSVSGNDIMGNTLMQSRNIGSNIINGGAFGPEGGLCVTLVLVVGIISIIFLQKRKTIKEGLDF